MPASRKVSVCIWPSAFVAYWIQSEFGLTPDNFDRWLINEREPNARLRRYLARARAWADPDPTAALSKLGDVAFF